MMLSRLLLTVTALTLVLPAEVSAENRTEGANTWIVIAPDNVFVTTNRAEIEKLVNDRKKQHLLVVCTEYQLEGGSVDGKPSMKLQCKNVTVTTEGIRDDTMQSNIRAESMTYESASQALELTGNVILRSESFQGMIQAGSMHLNLNENSIHLEATGADVRLESFPYRLQAQTRDTERKPNALFFSASWCGPCQTMQPIVSKLKSAGYQIETIDVDRESKMARRYNVMSLPQFIVLDGETVRDRAVGVQSFDALKRLLRGDGSRPAPPPMAEPADDGTVSAMKPISVIACPQANCTGIQIIPDVGHAGDQQSLHLDGVDIFVPATFASDVNSGTYVVRDTTNVIRTGYNPDSIQNPFGAYQPLIPELFDAPLRKDTPNRSFQFGSYYFTR